MSNLTLDEAVQALIAADIKLSIDFDSSHEPCPLIAEDAVHLFGTPTSWKLLEARHHGVTVNRLRSGKNSTVGVWPLPGVELDAGTLSPHSAAAGALIIRNTTAQARNSIQRGRSSTSAVSISTPGPRPS